MMNEIPPFRPGDRLSRAALNRLIEAIQRAEAIMSGHGLTLARTAAGTAFAQVDSPAPLFVELAQHLPAHGQDGLFRVMRRDSSAPPNTDPFLPTADVRASLMDTSGGPWLAGSRVATLWNAAAGKRIPIPCTQWHLAELQHELHAGGSVQVRLWTAGPEVHEDTGLEVVAHDWMLGDNDILEAGTRAIVMQHLASRRWYVVRSLDKRARVVRFRLSETLLAGGSTSALRVNWDGLDYVETVEITVNDFSAGTFQGVAGDEGMAAELPDRPGVYEILWLRQSSDGPSTSPDIIPFELTAELALGESAAAKVLEWSGSAWEATGTNITVYDMTGRSWSGRSGHRGWCFVHDGSSRHEIIWMERLAERIEGTLAEDMGYTTAGEAEAHVDLFYRGRDPGLTVQVHDPQGVFARCMSGAKYKATWDDVEDRYVLTSCQQPARWMRFTALADFAPTDATIDAEVKDSWDGHGVRGASGSPPQVTIHNLVDDSADPAEYIFNGDAGGTGLAVYDPEEDAWRMVSMECPLVPTYF